MPQAGHPDQSRLYASFAAAATPEAQARPSLLASHRGVIIRFGGIESIALRTGSAAGNIKLRDNDAAAIAVNIAVDCAYLYHHHDFRVRTNVIRNGLS